jgi:hypothetical protein
MANYRKNNVLVVDTSAEFDGKFVIAAINYIGAASGTASIKDDVTGGSVLWEEAGTANVHNQVNIEGHNGIYVTVTNSAKVYIYLK